MSWRVRALAAVILAGIAACGEPPAAPVAGMRAVSSASRLTQSDRYIVYFNNEIPSTFASQVASLGGTVTATYDGAGLAVVSGLTADAAQSLASYGDVGADEMFQMVEPTTTIDVEAVADVADASPFSASDPTQATVYPRQWGMRQIRANAAWAAGKLGSPSVKVAILDTGIDYLYPDLVGRVDMVNSTSFTSDSGLVKAYFPTRRLFTDLHYHGTHVAATVASNSRYVAGVTTQTTLMAVKVLNVNGGGLTSWILGGIVWAADHGANAINMSLGDTALYTMKDKATKDFFNKAVDRAFKYAHSKGVTIVVAAGNEAQNLDVKQTFKPFCGSMHAICVSATGPTAGGTFGPWTNPDAFADYSNYGLNEVDVAAPGGNRGTSVTSACSTSSLKIPLCQTGVFVLGLSGTSMATPHVTGLVALLLAEQTGGALGDVRSAIFNNATDLGAPGKDAYFGNGRIDVAKSLGLQ